MTRTADPGGHPSSPAAPGTRAPHGHGASGSQAPSRNAPIARGEGRDKLLFLDAFSGIAGDMLVAALLDLGVPQDLIAEALAPLPLEGYRLEFSRQTRSGIVAGRFQVQLEAPQQMRDYAVIRDMLENTEHLEKGAQQLALRAFRLLAEAEAEVHGTDPERVHFHEVGAVDSIVDIVASAVALDFIGARVICSPLPMGRGWVASRHGTIPSPAPATVLCLRGAPTYDAGVDAELVTPTGACLVASSATSFSRWPALNSERVGWGAGSRELPDRPNLLRAILGADSRLHYGIAQHALADHVLLEANIDDMSAEITAFALQRILEAKALDAWTTPIGMKKGRPALMLSALAERRHLDQVARAMLTETTTLGLRVRAVDRIERKRRIVQVDTPYGKIGVKVADADDLPLNLAPEYEDCRRAAQHHGVPIKQVFASAISAYGAAVKSG